MTYISITFSQHQSLDWSHTVGEDAFGWLQTAEEDNIIVEKLEPYEAVLAIEDDIGDNIGYICAMLMEHGILEFNVHVSPTQLAW